MHREAIVKAKIVFEASQRTIYVHTYEDRGVNEHGSYGASLPRPFLLTTAPRAIRHTPALTFSARGTRSPLPRPLSLLFSSIERDESRKEKRNDFTEQPRIRDKLDLGQVLEHLASYRLTNLQPVFIRYSYLLYNTRRSLVKEHTGPISREIALANDAIGMRFEAVILSLKRERERKRRKFLFVGKRDEKEYTRKKSVKMRLAIG